MSDEIKHHHVSRDPFNWRLRIERRLDGAVYAGKTDAGQCFLIPFHGTWVKGDFGATDEALLAVVLDRLQRRVGFERNPGLVTAAVKISEALAALATVEQTVSVPLAAIQDRAWFID